MSKSLLILSLLATSLCLTMAADLTWYDNAGLGACGPYVNALTDNIAAISKLRWTTANPNNDPLCGLCVTVSWQGKNLTLPVRDKCEACAYYDVDLGKPAFSKLANPNVGRLRGAITGLHKC